MLENAQEFEDFHSIDQLMYAYGNHQLQSVSDQAPALSQPLGYPYSQTELAYDAMGNLIADAAKGLSEGIYSYLNLPMKFSGTEGPILFDYDASGRKWAKHALGTIHYLQGLEYHDTTLFALNHEEGRIVFNLPGEGNRYETAFKDHLGNNRSIVADIDADGFINTLDDPNTPENEREVIEELHYYPFGMPFVLPCCLIPFFRTNDNIIRRSAVRVCEPDRVVEGV